MSNYKAIATVTATIGTLLTAATTVVDGAEVSFERPSQLEGQAAPAEAGINVYLYRVQMDASFRNEDLPTRLPDGRLEQRPMVALDLDYLLTFYGDDSRFEPQLLMASAESLIHAQPVLTPQEIGKAIDAYPTILDGSDLATQIQRVRLTPISLNLEDLSKVWSVFVQAPYLLSVAYQASVVLIRPEIPPPAPALPVRHRRLHVFPFTQPVITQVSPSEAVVGEQITIVGRSFSSDPVAVIFPSVTLRVSPTGPSRVTCTVPHDVRAGVCPVVVAVEANMGTTDHPDLRPLLRSNVAAFVVRPTIKSITYEGTADIVPPRFVVRAAPDLHENQTLTLWLEEVPPEGVSSVASAGHRVYGLHPLPFSGPTHTVTFAATGVAKGTYVARLTVDDADSVPGDADRVTVP